jgi:crotonobetainyl-CoA:carnitine CoA-transferase CaiB-like acyl-CoA transferase
VTSAPLLGQDNETVYAELAGCTQEQLVQLRADKII